MANNKAFKVKNGLELEAYSKAISDTAVDVFVYDTSKDSDGGAWRKRTQATSWYNETLNTATRGSRKDFPAVAVIVAESNQVTIYDGDDPDMPMWMVFNGTYDANLQDNYLLMWSGTGNNISCTTMSNGKLGVGATTGGGLISIDFISEFVRYYRDLSSSFTGAIYSGTIADRNTTTHTYVGDYNEFAIVNTIVNDVAMTVLPNAPIDAATGLPAVTTAVATDGGYSIIKDDGTVVDGTCTQTSHTKVEKIGFTEDNMVFYGGFDYYLQNRSRLYRVDNILSSDTVLSTSNSDPQNSAELYGFTTTIAANDKTLVVDVAEGSTNDYLSDPQLAFSDSELRFANFNGVYKVARNKTLPSAGLANKITSTYNTGWMNGDIKLTTLSDTDDTDVTGAELVTNGDLSSTTGWNLGGNWSIDTGAGTASHTSGASGSLKYTPITTAVVGETYVLTVNVTASSSAVILVGITGGPTYTSIAAGSTGTFQYTFVATASDPTVEIYQSSGGSCTVDNVSLRLAEEDRSVNGNGLQVFGSITKDPVASGADLVAYSNWGLSNYLMQPPNADIAVNSDRTFVTWFKTSYTSNYSYLFSITGSSLGYGLAITTTDGYLYAYDNVNGADNTTTAVADGNWHCAALVHSGGYKKLYVDGKLAGSFAASDVTFDSDANLYLGLYKPAGGSLNYNLSGGSMALFRMSHTAASPEQIAKIYNDEKQLFQAGAQATLYGTSDAVTALAYDDSTDLLHVGTSAGRSVFQGLRRVDNTTDAVGAAISASNGLVAED